MIRESRADDVSRDIAQRVKQAILVCDKGLDRIGHVGSSQIGILDFRQDLESIRHRVKHITTADQETAMVIHTLARELVPRLRKMKNSAQKNPGLLDSGDSELIRGVLHRLDDLLVDKSVTPPFLPPNTELVRKIRALPRLESLITTLATFKQTFGDNDVTCRIKYAAADQHFAYLVDDHLSAAGITVYIDRGLGPMSGRPIGAFEGTIAEADYVLVVGSKAYRQQFSSDPLVLQRHQKQSRHVIRLLIEGNAYDAFPNGLNYTKYTVIAKRAEDYPPAIMCILARCYSHAQLDDKNKTAFVKKHYEAFSVPPPVPIEGLDRSISLHN